MGLHSSSRTVDFMGGRMHSSQLQGETAQLGNTKRRHTYVMSVALLYTATQQRRRRRRTRRSTARSTSNVALSLRFFKVGYYNRWDHTAAVELLYMFVGGCMHSSQLQGETAQLGNTKQTHTHIYTIHDERSTTTSSAQQRRRRRRT